MKRALLPLLALLIAGCVKPTSTQVKSAIDIGDVACEIVGPLTDNPIVDLACAWIDRQDQNAKKTVTMRMPKAIATKIAPMPKTAPAPASSGSCSH